MFFSALGFEMSLRRKAATLAPVARSPRGDGWFPVVRDPYPGAWQANQEIGYETALSYAPVFSCVSLIAADIGKLTLRLVERDDEGIWRETTNPAYSPVLRKPNRYQTTQKFVEQWITSKEVHGNTYALKERDQRGVVKSLYILDPTKVWPLVASDGAVYYELKRNDLAGLSTDDRLVVPASEIIHDVMFALFHPLIGVSALFAAGLAALQGLTIQQTSTNFFANGLNPSGMLIAPGDIDDADAKRLKEYFEENYSGKNAGRVAMLSNGMKYEPLSRNAVDSQLIEQLKWTAETIAACYHIPAHLIGVGPPPPFANIEAMQQQYRSQCLHALITAFETALDDGLGLAGTNLGTEFDIDDLIYLDTATRTAAASAAIGSGAMSPNEARRKYFGLGSVKGGDTPYMQQQNYSLAALDERDKTNPLVAGEPPPTAPPARTPPPPGGATDGEPPPDDQPPDETKVATWARLAVAILRKDWTGISNGL